MLIINIIFKVYKIDYLVDQLKNKGNHVKVHYLENMDELKT